MKCMVLGCEREARGDVASVDMGDYRVPAHFCRYCLQHPCEMETYLRRRFAR